MDLINPSTLLALWLIIAAPAAIATARFDRPLVAVLLVLTGPAAWWAWALARHRHQETALARGSRRFLLKV